MGGMGQVWLAEQTEPVTASGCTQADPGWDVRFLNGAAIQGREAVAGHHGSSGDCQGLRCRHDARRTALFGDGVCGWPSYHRLLRFEEVEHSRTTAVVQPCLRRRAARAPEGDHPSRSEALEHSGGGSGRQADAAHHRLRSGKGDRAARLRARRCSRRWARFWARRAT